MPSAQESAREEIWPSCFIALLAVIQLLLTFAIVGLETTSLVFDLWHSMSFAGFYCPLFFMITWISMFTVTCCNKGSLGCAIHVLVENILSIIAASVLLYFNNLFLNNPYTCLFGSTYQCSRAYYSDTYFNTSSSSGFMGIYDSTSYTVKLGCIKGELACAALMLTTCVIYMIIFIVVAVKVRNTHDEVYKPYNPRPMPGVSMSAPSNSQLQIQPITVRLDQRSIDCPNCRMNVPIRVSLPTSNEHMETSNNNPISTEPRLTNDQSRPAVIPLSTVSNPNPIDVDARRPVELGLSEYEMSWRSTFPNRFSLILGIVQYVFILLIFILEIASLAVIVGFRPTGVGIWCPIPFSIAAGMKIWLDYKWEQSRVWATRVLIAEIVLLVFSFILIGIVGDYVQNGGYIYSWYSSNNAYPYVSTVATNTLTTKYQITQAQLAFGILLMFSGWVYVGIYIYVTVVGLWKPFHTLDLPHLFREQKSPIETTCM